MKNADIIVVSILTWGYSRTGEPQSPITDPDRGWISQSEPLPTDFRRWRPTRFGSAGTAKTCYH
jgi:hypothetical protein